MERLILPSRPIVQAREITVTQPEADPVSQATGVIFAGGMGTRMKEVTLGKDSKQTLLLRRNLTILDNPIELMRTAGVRTIILATQDSMYGNLRRSVTNSENSNGICYVVEDFPPKGVINSLKTVIQEKNIQTTIIKADGDEAHIGFDLLDMYSTHVRNHHPVTCLLSEPGGEMEKYKLWLDDNNKVIRAEESSHSINQGGLSLAGIWIIEPSQFPLIAQSTTHGDFMRKCITSNTLYGYVSRSTFFNVNTPKDLVAARRSFAK